MPKNKIVDETIEYQAVDQTITYLFSARKDQETAVFYLNPADLKEKAIKYGKHHCCNKFVSVRKVRRILC